MKTGAASTVSACLIVRNEAENLRPCLESLGDLASEIIVVDTGSSDNTVRIARELGVRVHSFPWIDDFAAARNESIRHATQEWIFWLDADDRLSPQAVAQLKRAASSGAADAYLCLVRSRHADGSRDVTEHIRLFRNGLGIRFSSPIHETVYPDLLRLGLRLTRTGILVEHTGYVSAEVAKRKSERNLPILDRELAQHPEQAHLLFYRGHARSNVGDFEGSAADMRRYLARTKPSDSFHQLRFWAYADLGRALEKLGEQVELERLLGNALAEFPEHPYLLAALGRVLIGLDRAQEALRKLHSAREALGGPERGLWPPRAWIELGLAEGYRSLQERDKAIHWAEQARIHAPEREEADALLARLCLETGRVPVDARIRGLVFLGSGNHSRAAECFAEAIEAAPRDPKNYRYLAIALKGLGREEDALEAWRLAALWQAQVREAP